MTSSRAYNREPNCYCVIHFTFSRLSVSCARIMSEQIIDIEKRTTVTRRQCVKNRTRNYAQTTESNVMWHTTLRVPEVRLTNINNFSWKFRFVNIILTVVSIDNYWRILLSMAVSLWPPSVSYGTRYERPRPMTSTTAQHRITSSADPYHQNTTRK